MVMSVSIIMSGISIALLLIYGADVYVATNVSPQQEMESKQGFLPFDSKTRGIGLGMPSVILPIVAFFISRKEPSQMLGWMLIICGILILVGGVAALSVTDKPVDEIEASGRNVMAEAGPLLGVGVLIIAFGIIKLKKSYLKR